MSEKQKSVCDGYIYIPQYGAGTASLNVNVATGIILHKYAHWREAKGSTTRISAINERIDDR
jgi:tRNA G18 (ribose-2'-O)-methylase SpoU